nr:MAG: capsid protein [Smacoviridae sp.]
MPTIQIRETYDLSTTVNRMGLIGIHTPSMELLKKLYPGFVLNYKKVKADKMDLALASASLLPADPLQVGVESGEIAPQDLFNPILYRAVSSDSFNTIMNRVYAMNDLKSGTSLVTPGTVGNDPFTSMNSTDVYYSLLSEDGWAKAMPQSGFTMRNVRPLVYEMLNTFGNSLMPVSATSLNTVNLVNNAGNEWNSNNIAQTFRGASRPMPAIPTISGMTSRSAGLSSADQEVVGTWSIPVGKVNDIPKTFCAVIVLPPAKLHKLFFRITIVWTISFFEICSTIERASLVQMSNLGTSVYSNQIVETTSKILDNENSTVDTKDVDATMIMQS